MKGKDSMMSIIYFIVIFILWIQWIHWLITRYPEIRNIHQDRKMLYRTSVFLLFIGSIIMSYFAAQMASRTQIPEFTGITFITILFIGMIGIVFFRVYINNRIQIFKTTVVSGFVFSLLLLGMGLFCFISLNTSR
ncbi:hypothetical protein SAMN05443246_4158 [Paenibacillus sp. GP183]|nr:hypothetical protein SAMN05443246_4158 [Paenibacillus sp. GP183]